MNLEAALFGVQPTMTVDVAAGIIQKMQDAGLGIWTDEGETFPEDMELPAIFPGPPLAQPIYAIGVNIYPVVAEEHPGVDLLGVQFQVRTPSSTPEQALALADKLEDTFHGIEYQDLMGWHIPIMWRNSFANLGPNDNDHYQITDSYHLYIDKNKEGGNHG